MNKEIWGGVGIALIVAILATGYKGCETLQALTDAAKQTAQSTKGPATELTGTLKQATATLAQAANTLQSAQATIDKAQPVLAGLKATADKLNAPCTPVKGVVYTSENDKPCGTLADLNQTLRTARGTLGTVERAGLHYDRQLATLDSQETTLFNGLNNTIGAISPVVAQYGVAAANLNDWLKSKQLKEMADNGVSMTESGKAILKDSADEIHGFVHPTKKKLTFWTATEAAGDYTRHFMPSIF